MLEIESTVFRVIEMELAHSEHSEAFEACLCLSANVCQMLSSVCLESFLESQIKRKKLFFFKVIISEWMNYASQRGKNLPNNLVTRSPLAWRCSCWWWYLPEELLH